MSTSNTGEGSRVTLGEEEISDVSLATFYVFDKEGDGTSPSLSAMAAMAATAAEAEAAAAAEAAITGADATAAEAAITGAEAAAAAVASASGLAAAAVAEVVAEAIGAGALVGWSGATNVPATCQGLA
jgi:hypothetical protein